MRSCNYSGRKPLQGSADVFNALGILLLNSMRYAGHDFQGIFGPRMEFRHRSQNLGAGNFSLGSLPSDFSTFGTTRH
jgi:hypothetical protein